MRPARRPIPTRVHTIHPDCLAFFPPNPMQLVERGGISGLHVMPITKASKKMVLGMVADGSLLLSKAP